jgi:hypothetical protein
MWSPDQQHQCLWDLLRNGNFLFSLSQLKINFRKLSIVGPKIVYKLWCFARHGTTCWLSQLLGRQRQEDLEFENILSSTVRPCLKKKAFGYLSVVQH